MPLKYMLGTRFIKGIGTHLPPLLKKATMIYISLKWTLKALLEMPGAFEMLMNYISELKRDRFL